jgi:hypothetical protein
MEFTKEEGSHAGRRHNHRKLRKSTDANGEDQARGMEVRGRTPGLPAGDDGGGTLPDDRRCSKKASVIHDEPAASFQTPCHGHQNGVRMMTPTNDRLPPNPTPLVSTPALDFASSAAPHQMMTPALNANPLAELKTPVKRRVSARSRLDSARGNHSIGCGAPALNLL